MVKGAADYRFNFMYAEVENYKEKAISGHSKYKCINLKVLQNWVLCPLKREELR